MSKLSEKATISKLNEVVTFTSGEAERRVRKISSTGYPRSYRLDSDIMNMLKNTLDKINELSSKKVSEARLIKALIFLSKEISLKKILKALEKTW